jgi:hypothetical protein
MIERRMIERRMIERRPIERRDERSTRGVLHRLDGCGRHDGGLRHFAESCGRFRSDLLDRADTMDLESAVLFCEQEHHRRGSRRVDPGAERVAVFEAQLALRRRAAAQARQDHGEPARAESTHAEELITHRFGDLRADLDGRRERAADCERPFDGILDRLPHASGGEPRGRAPGGVPGGRFR